MVKVLRILNRFNIGGPTHNATFLTKFLEPEFKTKLIAGKKLESEAGSEFILKNYEIDYDIIDDMSRSINPLKDFRSFIKIRRIIKDFKPDIVHTHASKSGALGRLASISMRVPIIVHTFHGHVFHSYFGYLKTKFYIFLERYLASKSSAIIAISKLQQEELINDFKICSPNKMHVIPLGFDLQKFQSNVDLNRDLFRKEFGLLDDEIAIGIVGRLTPIKNHTFFLKAIQNIQNKTSSKFKVFIIGDGEDKKYIQNLANKFQLKNNLSDQDNPLIYFTSWRKDMDVVYAGLDIVALTSLNEGTPVTLIEAQAANKPIVSTNVGGVLDVVLEGITANTCSREDINSFSINLSNLVDNSDLRKEMGSSGYNHVNSLFSYKRLVKDVSTLYKNLLLK
jgi:glycosyltransferase involved in cell wall biosynthesis